jgi:hypothetical protein
MKEIACFIVHNHHIISAKDAKITKIESIDYYNNNAFKLSRDCVIIDRVWIGNWISELFDTQLVTILYKSLSHTD